MVIKVKAEVYQINSVYATPIRDTAYYSNDFVDEQQAFSRIDDPDVKQSLVDNHNPCRNKRGLYRINQHKPRINANLLPSRLSFRVRQRRIRQYQTLRASSRQSSYEFSQTKTYLFMTGGIHINHATISAFRQKQWGPAKSHGLQCRLRWRRIQMNIVKVHRT